MATNFVRGRWPNTISSCSSISNSSRTEAMEPFCRRKAQRTAPEEKKENAPQFDLRTELFRMTGTDLTQIDGIDVTTTMTILSEAGWDMSKWKTEHHFVSWLLLRPDNRISGDKIIGKGRLPTNNRVTNALRMAASTLRLSKTYLGAQFRRLRTKLGAPVAIKAMVAKLARLVYRMLRYGMTFVDRGAESYDAQHHKLQINSQTQSRQSRIPNHRSSGSVVSGEPNNDHYTSRFPPRVSADYFGGYRHRSSRRSG